MKRDCGMVILAALWLGGAASASAAVSLVSSVSENFDSMGTTGTAPPAGWSMKVANGGSNTTWSNSVPIAGSGSISVATMTATSGALTAASAPTTTNNNGFNAQGSAAADRVLATSPTSVAGAAIQLQLVNDTGKPLSSLTTGYEIRRFTAAASANELPGYWLFYSLDGGSSWTNVAALNPTLAGSGVQVPSTAGVTVVPPTNFILGSSWAEGTQLLLRWVDDNAAATSPDQIIGLDNVSIAAPPTIGSPPSVSLTSPADKIVFIAPASTTLTADATDIDGGIVKVEFYQGAVKLGETSIVPYSFEWTGITAGSYSVTARATDNDGNVSVSQVVTVYVNSAPGSGSLTRGPYLQKAAPASMTVRWRSSQPVAGRLRFGPAPAALDSFVDESTATMEHEITLAGLTPATTYFYSVGSSLDTLAGGDASCVFYTPPNPGTSVNTRVWVLGDAGTGTISQISVRDAFNTWTGSRTPDLVLQLGDNAYNGGFDTEYQAKVFDVYGTLMRRSPFWSCLGNHETNQATAFVDDYPYFSIYSFPTAGECGGVASGTEHYYAWDFGNIHFISLDSMTADRSPDGAMATWLANDLASTTATWIIALWHHPPYTKGSHDSDTETPLVEMRQNIVPLLEAGGVDLVLCGHSHCYERSFLLDGHYGVSTSLTPAMKKDAGDGCPSGNGAYGKPLTGNRSHFGAVYCVTGAAGQISGGLLNHPAHYLSLNHLGSTVLDIEGATLNAIFLRETGAVDDTFSIVKQGGSTPPIVTTLSADAVTSTSATLRGSVNPAGTSSTAKFQFGLTSEYGTDLIIALAPDNGLSSQAVSATLTGLTPGTVHHFRVSASNTWGTVDGGDLVFTTQTPFEEWAAGKGLAGPSSAPSADADLDGSSNLLEWAFGTEPLAAEISALTFADSVLTTRGSPVIQISGGDLRAVFCRRKNGAWAGLTYTCEFSSDLVTWSAVDGAPLVIAEDAEMEAVSVAFPSLVNGLPPRFFRLVVSMP